MHDTAVIMNNGMNYLLEKLGALETEIFISHLLREPSDYTKWRQDHLYNDVSGVYNSSFLTPRVFPPA